MTPLFPSAPTPVLCRRPISGLIRGALLCALLGWCAAVSSFAQEAPKGLSKEQVLQLLKEDPGPRVEYLVNKYGIGFYLTPETENELRDAGATPDLMTLIRKLAPQKPAEVKPPSPPPPPVLVVHAQPGDSEVYVDDVRRGQTGSDGTLKLGDLSAGTHKLRISLSGYRSYEVSIDLAAGETNTVMAELQPNPPPAPKEETPAQPVAPTPAPKPRGDPNDPLTPHEMGIYFLQQTGKERQLIELEEAPPAARTVQASRGAAFGGFANFAGPKWKSTIYGEKAHLRFPAGRPVFYFYFLTAESEASTYGLSYDAFRSASSPAGFVLVRLQTHKNVREIPAKGSVTATVQEKDTVAFDYERVAPGIFKVQTKSDLEPGEYGFLYGGMLQAMMQTWLFDFGIDKAK